MRMRMREAFLLFIILFCLTFAASPASAADDDDDAPPDDGVIVTEENLDALLAFKQSLEDPLGALRSWNQSSGQGACSGTWTGIKCARGQVIVIQLASKGLRGTISSRVGELQSLRKLNLHSNRIGGQIPASLAAIASLRSIYLFGNRIAGQIPAGLGAAPLIQAIDLSRNSLAGAVPASIASSPKLFLLNLAANNLTGSIPPEWGSSSSLVTLVLAGNGISGSIPDTWGRNLSSPPLLRVLDFTGNRIGGNIPATLGNMAALEEIRLPGNDIDGGIDGHVLGRLRRLRVIDVSGNRINGSIPDAVGELANLTALDVSDNLLTGDIPSSLADIPSLKLLNVSHNRLTGRVPAGLDKRFNASSFSGNAGLCGYSIIACPSPSPHASAPGGMRPKEQGKKNRLSKVSLICIVVGGALALGAAVCMLMLVAWRFREQRATSAARSKNGKAAESRSAAAAGGAGTSGSGGASSDNNGNGSGKLVHFDGPFTFTADDLLCATAEVMGKSTYGTVYKATLENGNTVVVKRLREGIVRSQREFETEVTALGRIRHPNLVALRAYYWGPKDEKLLVFDFVNGGSLAAYLHARGPETPLGWTTRMRIALGAARGLVYLHDTEKMIHGNLTSSNILLDGQLNAVVSDYGLSRLMTTSAGSTVLATAGSQGYRAPEVGKLKKGSTKSDVYSYGIVLLELLTGKAPGDAVSTGDGGALDLPEWVSSVVKEEWTSEVFDVELLKGAAPSEDDMLNTLQLAMSCVSAAPSSRPDMTEVLKQIEAVCEHRLSPSTSTTLAPAAQSSSTT